jgi:O-antigen ligase
LGFVLGGLLVLGTDWSASGFSRLPGAVQALVPQWTPFWKPEGYRGFNANLAGGTLAMVLPVPLGFLLFGRRWWVRLIMLVEGLILGGLLALSFSRGAMMGVAVAVLVMLVAYDRRWLWLMGAITLGLGSVIAWPGPAQVVETILGSGGTGVVQGLESRVELWSRGIYMMQDFAFTGVGMGMVGQVLPLLYPTFLIPSDAGIDHVHNLYLQFGAETGFPGLILLLSCLLLLLVLGWDAVRRAKGTRWAPLATGLLGTVVALMVHGLVDSVPLAPKVYLITWSIFGLAVALDLALRTGDLGPNA